MALSALCACRYPPADAMFDLTGEEDLLPQLRAIANLATNFLHPQPRTSPEVAVAHTGYSPFGINVFLHHEVELEKRERSIQMIADAGFHWVRQEFPWEDIEIHGKGDFVDRRNDPAGIRAWAKYDHIVGLSRQHDVEVIARLSNPPAWTRTLTDTAGTYAPPDNLGDWSDYVYAVVSRYREQVRFYQLWNEPNIYPEWGEYPVDPEGYTRLLCEGYRRAKSADPNAVIISGALAPTVSMHPGPGPGLGLSDFVFLQRMYDAGASDCFDIMSVNDYMLWSGPTDRRMRPDIINFARPAYIRDIMVANGDAHKPIWISEMNSNAVPNDPSIQNWGAYGQVTLDQQARYAVRAYQRAMAEWSWAGVVNFWYFKRATDSERTQAWYYFRMVEPDFAPLPVYAATQKFTLGLVPALHPGHHQESHWALRYDTGWIVARNDQDPRSTYRRAVAPGATLRLEFRGASLTLVPAAGSGVIEVSVDSGPARSVSLNGQHERLVSQWRSARHSVALTAVSGDVSVDGFIVEPGVVWWQWLLTATCATGGLVLLRRLVKCGA